MTIPTRVPNINIPDVAADPGLQTFLTSRRHADAFLKRYPDVYNYLKKRKLKKTVANITQATNALRAQKRAEMLPKGRDVSIVQADASRLVIYGECIVGGTITFIDSRGNNRYLDIVVSICTHEIDSVQKLILDEYEVVFNSGLDGWARTLRHRVTGELITSPTDFVFMRVATGEDGQSAILDLVAQNPKWTVDHKQSGVAHAYIILVWNAEIFGDGLPDISFQVRGKKVYDPRSATTRYTATASLCIADYLTNTRYGVGIPYSRLNEASLIAAANVDDELVDIQGGGQEYRYTINGCIETGAQSHASVLERMCAAYGGHIHYANGKWTFWPAKWRPPVVDITEDDIRGPIKMQTMVSRDAIFNCVKGKHVSAAQRYIETDYPAVKNSSYVSLDGEEIVQDIDFPFVSTASTCQRLAKLELERNRQGIQLELLVSPKAYQVQVGENVTVTLSRYGWSGKAFEIVECDFVINESGDSPEVLVELKLRETGAGVFNWNYWEETLVDVAPNTNLPNPFSVPHIMGLTAFSGTGELYRRGDGTIAPRVRLVWTALTDYFVTSGGFIEAQSKPSSSETWIDAPRIPATSSTMYLTDVQDGTTYDIRVRAVNAFGRPGEWATIGNYFVIGKTAPPADVSGFAAVVTEYGIGLAWNAVTDLDLAYYEVREGITWGTASIVEKTKSTSVALPIRAVGSYTFRIRAVDTSGNVSTTETTVDVSITAPKVLAGSFSFDGANVVLDWEDASGGSWATEDYSISYGVAFDTSTFVAKVKASQFTVRADWNGSRKFWVVPNDIYGNAGTPFSFDVNVIPPPAVTSLSAKVIDNNVLLSWGASTGGALPVEFYQVRRGATFSGAAVIGTTSATYSTLFELVSGDYTYWIVPVDTAGNIGTESHVTATIDEPVDFVLQSDTSLVLADAPVLTNVLIDYDGTLLLPADKSETWSEHFTQNSWTTPQDQITAGYPIYMQPTPSTATYSQTHDIGTIITGGSVVRCDVDVTNIAGTLTLTPTLSVSEDNSTWRAYNGVWSVFESNFRYVRITITASSGGTAVSRINSVRIHVAVKLKRDSGSVVALASDTAGTTVAFTKTFFDIVGPPQLTPTQVIRAAEILGSNNYLTCGDHADFEPGDGDFTIAAWIRLQDVKDSPTILGKWDSASATQKEYLFYIDATSQALVFAVTADGSTEVRLTGSVRVPIGQWMLVIAWHDAVNNQLGIRWNKTPAETLSHSAGIYAGTRTNAFEVGGRSAAANRSLRGQIKNVAVWKGRVLSSSDVDELFDKGFQQYSELSSAMKTSLVGWWSLNESSGTRDDSHTGNHDLTVGGTVGSRILPLLGVVDFTDAANPTHFNAFVFTENQVRATSTASWYADGYTTIG